jgi:hypothetical protein
VIIIGSGKSGSLADLGYIPQKVCCRDSKALDKGVARRYIMSVSPNLSGIKPNCLT